MRRILAAAVMAGSLAFATGCAYSPPPVSEKVQQYYDEHVANRGSDLATAPAAKSVVAIGDSYSAGAGGTNKGTGFIAQLARNQAWNLTNLARGGTGYAASVTSNAKVACGLDYCPTYQEMIKDAAVAKPELIIVGGGRNDSNAPDADEAAAIRDFYTQLHAAVPGAKIVGLSPLWDSSPQPASLASIATAVKSSVESVGGTYVDIGQPLASHPELVAADKVHPNDAGHAAIFAAALQKLQEDGIAIK